MGLLLLGLKYVRPEGRLDAARGEVNLEYSREGRAPRIRQ